jgi:hypothetical protein
MVTQYPSIGILIQLRGEHLIYLFENKSAMQTCPPVMQFSQPKFLCAKSVN